MALVLHDRVQETSTTTGTGSVTLDGAALGYQSFAVIGNGNTTFYCIAGQGSSEWEVGVGTYTSSGTTLSRDTVLASSNSGSLVNFSAGSKAVFVTYPSEKSVNLDASGNVSALGTVSSGTWQGSTVGVAYGGTGVTSSSGANSVVLRDADQNITVNSVTQNLNKVTSAGGTTTLTTASNHFQVLTGTSTQTFKLPDATSLPVGSTWVFDNDSTQNLTVTDYANGSVDVVAPGGYSTVVLEANGTVAGEWLRYGMIPGEVNWGTNSLDLGGSTIITNGVWQGTAVGTAYGGTGLTSFGSANYALYSSNATTLTAGTLPIAAGGTGNTTASAAFNALSPITTTGDLIVGNGSNSATRLPIGASNQVLTSNGTTATWETLSGGTDIVTTDFTATASQTTFTVSYVVGLVEVFRNGVKLAQADFTANNGTTVVLATAANSGDIVEVVSYQPINVYANITTDTFSGNGSTTAFTMSVTPYDAASLLVVISGVVQAPDTYSVAGTTLTFSAAPPSGTNNISVRYLGVASTGAVTTFSGGTTGLTPSSATGGAVTLAGTLNVANGGTGQTTANAAFNALAPSQTGNSGKYLTTDGANASWDQINISTADITGTLPVANGGTGLTSLTAGYIPYGNGTSAFSSSSGLYFSGSNLGIGTSSPAQKLDVNGTANFGNINTGNGVSTGTASIELGGLRTGDGVSLIDLHAVSGSDYATRIIRTGGTNGNFLIDNTGTGAFTLRASGAGNMVFDTSNTERMRLDSSGNLGLGVTPSAWSGFKAIDVNTISSFASATNRLQIAYNSYWNGSNYIYKTTAEAARYDIISGQHQWFNAASGTAGNAISFTQAMTLDASGNLGIGTSSPAARLHVDSGASSEVQRYNTSATAPYVGWFISGTRKAYQQWDTNYGWILDSEAAGSGIILRTQNVERARISAAGGFSVGTTADPGAGGIYATGSITANYSDDRLKTKLGGIENALDKVKSLSGFYYEANQTAQDLGYQPVREVGVSAQQVQAVLPEVVKPAPIDQQYLTVQYERIIPLLIEAIKELEAQVAELRR